MAYEEDWKSWGGVGVVCADGLLYYSVVFVACYTVRVNGLNVGSAGVRC